MITIWRYVFGLILSGMLLFGCRLEKPDPVAQSLAIFHKHPSDFPNQLRALDELAARELGLSNISWLDSLYIKAKDLRNDIKQTESDSIKVLKLTQWIYDTLKLTPIQDSNLLAASLPSQIIRNGRGSCLGITLIFLTMGSHLNLPLYPVFLPGHIFVRYSNYRYVQNIETLKNGLARTDSFYQEHFNLKARPWYNLESANPVQALAGLLFNLANSHRDLGKNDFALEEYKLVEEFLPKFPEALGSQGALFLASGELTRALPLFLSSFKGDSLAIPTRKNLAKLYFSQGDSLAAQPYLN